jgi:hypothetical protein
MPVPSALIVNPPKWLPQLPTNAPRLVEIGVVVEVGISDVVRGGEVVVEVELLVGSVGVGVGVACLLVLHAATDKANTQSATAFHLNNIGPDRTRRPTR